MRYVLLFFKCVLGAYALVQCVWLGLHWHDLVANGLRTGNLLKDLSQLINWWLFWAINYAVFDVIVSLILGSVLFGIIVLVRLLKSYRLRS